MSTVALTVCELPDDPEELPAAWQRLAAVVRRDRSDLVVLPELPFGRWLCTTPTFDADRWRDAVELDAVWRGRLGELGAAAVITTRPIVDAGARYNEAYHWRGEGTESLRAKAHLPHEDGFWERSWFSAAPPRLALTAVGRLRVGVLVCSELWHFEYARDYHDLGAGLVVVPRASTASWGERWLAAGRSAALVSGAWWASTNRRGGPGFGGDSWVIDPEGRVVARTTPDRPAVTVTVDLAQVDHAAARYPRTVL